MSAIVWFAIGAFVLFFASMVILGFAALIKSQQDAVDELRLISSQIASIDTHVGMIWAVIDGDDDDGDSEDDPFGLKYNQHN